MIKSKLKRLHAHEVDEEYPCLMESIATGNVWLVKSESSGVLIHLGSNSVHWQSLGDLSYGLNPKKLKKYKGSVEVEQC